ncbi:hypothetical protein A6A19_00860 [Actinobacillus delphinicola]|uniref:KAP family P-loop NTPase fold protein n=1 Tax=Actinobacillus delphinicola TaxID=51161 RepID=UPI0024417788|nr:P-loop NTPase fold protein [Actinobacillus delphinicola]MDG6896579.1 hypothetical protein [Actinobacillus delphinicola]
MNVDEMQNLTFESRDEFNRKPMAEKIIKILNADTDSFTPMVIDGDWGTGKTEFCFKLINLYKKKIENSTENKIKNTTVIYFDAFENDYLDNPLLSLLVEIANKLNQAEEKIIDKFKIIYKNTPTVLIKFASNMIFGDDITKVGTELLKDGKPKNALNIFQEIQSDMGQLKINLTALAANNPIIFFIDELDRCRPDYALKFLEVIKHTFDIPNIKFIFITNTEQLYSSIKHSYGNKIQADKYLDKFFKYRASLSLHTDRDSYNLTIYFINLFRKKISIFSYLEEPTFNAILFGLSNVWLAGKTLRDLENLIRYFNFYQIVANLPLYEPVEDAIKLATIFLAALDRKKSKEIFNSNYEQMKTQNVLFSDILKLPKNTFNEAFPDNISHSKKVFLIVKDTLNQLNGLD